jgi:ribosomal protein S18 acetylase RimI-like enzyme
MGFVEISYRANYYGAGRDALVMQRELNEWGS